MAPQFPRPGEIFNQRYQLLEILGSGGIGTVFKALQIDADRKIALKIMHSELADDQDFKLRFIREARALSLLSDPGIVTIYHIGVSEDGLPYIAMELIRGLNVRHLLNQEAKLDEMRAIRIVQRVAETLSYVHANGIVHRDIKPENIIIIQQPEPDTVKVIDFGLARLEGEPKLTNTGILLGSVHYMSPEQCQGKPAGQKSDIYSLCVCLYEMLAGSRPFEADTAIGVVYKHIHEPLAPIQKRQLACFDDAINDILRRGMAKQPEDRFQSMQDLAHALAGLSETLDAQPKAKQAGHRPVQFSTRNLIFSAAGTILALLFAFGIAERLQPKQSFRASDEFASKKSGADPELFSSHTRITYSAAKLIINKASSMENANRPAAIRLIDSSLDSKRCDGRAKCLLKAKRALLEEPGPRRLLLAKQAFEIGKAEYAKSQDQNCQDLYLASAAFCAERMLEASQFKEALELSQQMASVAKNTHLDGPGLFVGLMYTPGLIDFLTLEADASTALHDKQNANRIVDQMISIDFGNSKQAARIARILFALDRPNDVIKFIHVISDKFEDEQDIPNPKRRHNLAFLRSNYGPANIYNYEAQKAFSGLREIYAVSLELKHWEIAELSIERAKRVDAYASCNLTGGFDAKIRLEIDKAEIAFACGNRKSGEEQLGKLADEWLRANSTDRKEGDSELKDSNPFGLLLALLDHHLVDQAAAICNIISKVPDTYASTLLVPLEDKGSFRANRDFILERLSPFGQNPSISELIRALKVLRGPGLQ